MDEEGQAGRAAAAARWYAELQAPDAGAETWDAFEAWRRDPLNAAAFREIETALAVLDRSALARPARRRVPRAWLGALAAAVFVAGLAGLTLVGGRGADPAGIAPAVFATGIGERAVVDLADGSSAELNTASRIEVNFAGPVRRVRLERGQVLFTVMPGEAPFVVETAASRTEALGTVFEVYVAASGDQVTLLEGAVRVLPAAQAAGVRLQPGERVEVTGGRAGEVQQVDSAAAMAWRTGSVQFTDTRLADAAAELNRYSETRIIIDPRLADERLSGSFRAGEQEMFAEALSLYLPVEVIRSGKTIQVVPATD